MFSCLHNDVQWIIPLVKENYYEDKNVQHVGIGLLFQIVFHVIRTSNHSDFNLKKIVIESLTRLKHYFSENSCKDWDTKLCISIVGDTCVYIY